MGLEIIRRRWYHLKIWKIFINTFLLCCNFRESRDSDTPDEESMDYEPIEVKLEPVDDEESLISQDQTSHRASPSGKDLSCKICGKTFDKKEYLRKHNYRSFEVLFLLFLPSATVKTKAGSRYSRTEKPRITREKS